MTQEDPSKFQEQRLRKPDLVASRNIEIFCEQIISKLSISISTLPKMRH
jgi:hypothetical protein